MSKWPLTILKHQKKKYARYSAGLSISILFIILFFGLNPKDFTFSNNVLRIDSEAGIRFNKYGIAYTDPLPAFAQRDYFNQNGFSLEIALKPASYKQDSFNLILAIHNGKDNEQLIMGQWRSYIIVMNGDDYAHKSNSRRVAINLADPSSPRCFIAITSAEKDTHAYVNGQLIQTEKDLLLRIPTGDKVRLILGNSIYGKHSWKGDIYGLALYRHFFTDDDILRHFVVWSDDRHLTLDREYNPLMIYHFNGRNATVAFDQSGGNHDLEIPSRMQILEKVVLSWKWNQSILKKNVIQDMVINFLGFIPLGFFLTMMFCMFGGGIERHHLVMTIGLCFLISLIIEIAQAWMPSRSSQVQDLILNVFGAFMGVQICKFFCIKYMET
jgi:hypothetical protein